MYVNIGECFWVGFWLLVAVLAIVIARRRGGSRAAWEDAAFALVASLMGLGALFLDWLTSYDRPRHHDDEPPEARPPP